MQIKLINPSDITPGTDRVVLMTEAQLSRLKRVLAGEITDTFNAAHMAKDDARWLKSKGSGAETVKEAYQFRRKLLTKANKLGEVQKSLKNNAVNSAGLIEHMYAAGMVVGVIQDL